MPALARQLARWTPDVVALCEFRATPPSAALAAALRGQGLVHQATTADPSCPGVNAILLASRWPLRRVLTRRAPREPARFLLAEVAAPAPFTLGAMHVPNRMTGRKWPFLDAVLRLAERWANGPAVLIGDTNSGRPGLDEAPTCRAGFNAREGGWIDGLERAGWRDGFRHLEGEGAPIPGTHPMPETASAWTRPFSTGTCSPRWRRSATSGDAVAPASVPPRRFPTTPRSSSTSPLGSRATMTPAPP